MAAARQQRDAKRLKVCTQREVVVRLPRKTREVVDDHEVDLALVRPAVFSSAWS